MPSRFLWLNGVFDDKTVHAFESVSAASNFWQEGFLRALQRLGARVEVMGYPTERGFPFGRLLVRRRDASLLPIVDGAIVGYANLPGARHWIQYAALRRLVLRRLRQPDQRPDYLVVYSCLESADDVTPELRIARHVRETHGIPWICIVADGATPEGADAYVYLPWSNYRDAAQARTIHIDGGIAEIPPAAEQPDTAEVPAGTRALMYMGALTEHGGVTGLARAFAGCEAPDVELWICGRGANPELERIAQSDSRIKLKGFVETDELDRLARAAYAFVNPRPTSFAPNHLNYPSKLLHYLAYGRPVLSTVTPGMSPVYSELLVLVEDESDAALRAAIHRILSMPHDEYEDICQRVRRFGETHTWQVHVERFLEWLPATQ